MLVNFPRNRNVGISGITLIGIVAIHEVAGKIEIEMAVTIVVAISADADVTQLRDRVVEKGLTTGETRLGIATGGHLLNVRPVDRWGILRSIVAIVSSEVVPNT